MPANPLFTPLKFGAYDLPNRVFLAPMTRSRSAQPGDIPTDLMAAYYAQRASAGLQFTEATQISQQGKGYSFTPGIYSKEQISGWKGVTKRVHEAGGRIFLQAWHVGRMSHSVFHDDGLPVAPSAIAPDAQVWINEDGKGGSMVDCPTPRALRIEEIQAIVEDYRRAGLAAMEAGFDGVEIHAGNGYLIDQFMRCSSNKRTDAYGGSLQNRLRFPLEVVRALGDAIGFDRLGIRVAPFITQRGMDDPGMMHGILALARELDGFGLAYIHLVEADWDDAPEVPEDFRKALRAGFSGAIVVAGNYDAHSGASILERGLADAVAYGRKFLANPDLPARLRHGYPLEEISDPATLFGGDARGYTDYPVYDPDMARA